MAREQADGKLKNTVDKAVSERDFSDSNKSFYMEQPPNRLMSILMSAIGLALICFALIMVVISLLIFVFFHSFAALLVIFIILEIAGCILLLVGWKKTGRNTRFAKYIRIIGESPYTAISALADSTGKSVSFTVSDLGGMIERGMFFEAQIDPGGDWFILSKDAWQSYQKDGETEDQTLCTEK